MQIGYLVNSPWYDHSKLMLRILQSNYNWCLTLWIADLLVHQRALTLSAQKYHMDSQLLDVQSIESLIK